MPEMRRKDLPAITVRTEALTEIPIEIPIEIRTEVRAEVLTEILTEILIELPIEALIEDRTIADVIPVPAVPTRTEEVWAMADLRETDRTVALTDRAVRVWKMVRMTAAVAALVQVVTAAITIVAAIAEAMADRQIDSEITSRVRASLQRLPERILKRNVKRTRDVSVRRRISAPRKITSTKKRM